MCLNHLRTFKNYLLAYFPVYTFIHVSLCVCVCVCARVPWTAPTPPPWQSNEGYGSLLRLMFLNKWMKMDRVHPTLHRSAEFYPWTTSGVWRTQLRTIPRVSWRWCGVESQESMEQAGRIIHGRNRHVWMIPCWDHSARRWWDSALYT